MKHEHMRLYKSVGIKVLFRAARTRWATLISVFCSPEPDTDAIVDTELVHRARCACLLPSFH